MKRASFFLNLLPFYLLLLPFTALAVESINATFDDPQTYTTYVPPQFIPGQVVPTGANYSDRPYKLDGDVKAFKVENLSTMNRPALTFGNFLRIVDMDDYAANGAHFDFYDRSYDSGCVRVSWDVIFEAYDYYFFYFRNGHGDDPQRPTKSSIANIYTSGDIIYFESKQKIVSAIPYDLYEPIRFDTFFDLDNDRWTVMVNGLVLFEDAETIDAPFGLFIPGYGHDSGYMDGAMQIDNIEMVPMASCNWNQTGTDCNLQVPAPLLIFGGADDVFDSTGNYTRYKLYVKNWAQIPQELFDPAPNLPPCGQNHNASRTWVDILDGNDNRIYGFCALAGNEGLTELWFATRKGDPPPAQVKIRLHDRLCDKYYESNLVDIDLNGFCPELPIPQVEIIGIEEFPYSNQLVRNYRLSITNWDDYPEFLFYPFPNLPRCSMGEGSRTVVKIYDENGTALDEICSIGSPAELKEIIVTINPFVLLPNALKVVVEDRICDKSVESNLLYLTSQDLNTLQINLTGSGRVVSTDGKYVCDGANMSQPVTCSLDVPTGSTVTLKAIPIDGPTYTSSFLEWGGACSGVGNCTLTINSDTTVEAKFAALGIPVVAGLDPPVGPNIFTYSPVVDPVLDLAPAGCKPFAVGDIQGGTLALKVGLPSFTGPVDIYLALETNAITPPEIYLFVPQVPFGYTLAPYSVVGLQAWATSQVAPLYQSFYGEIPVNVLPAGDYWFYTLVTTPGSLNNYYLWVTGFTLP